MFDEDEDVFEQTIMHLRLQQWRNRRYITIIEGLPHLFDEKKILRFWKKNYSCNGNIIYRKTEKDKIERIILAGDQRENVREFLEYMGIAAKENIKIHGI